MFVQAVSERARNECGLCKSEKGLHRRGNEI
jgi:hypothetical protein